jgi:hypothetical protein
MKFAVTWLGVVALIGMTLWITADDDASESSGSGSAEVSRQRTTQPPLAVVDLSEASAEHLPEPFEKLHARTEPFIVDLTWSEVSGDTLGGLRSLKLLRGVYLFGTDATDGELTQLAGLPQLEAIDLGGCEVSIEGILQLKAARGLKRLGLASVRPPLDDDAIERIVAAFPRLESLSLDEAQLTDAGLVHIGKLTQLHYLNISQTKITDEGLPALIGLTKLRTLHASDNKIHDPGMKSLGQLASLEKLVLNFTNIGDAGLAEVRRLSNLKRIYFAGTRVTDAGLAHLKPLKTLEFVGLNEHITPKAHEALKEALPLYKRNKAG